MPARGCLSGDPHAFATFGSPLGAGAVRLIVHRAGGEAEICDASAEGRVLERRPAPPGLSAPRPEEPAFFLERRCVDARRLEAEDGRTILGWLAYPACG